MSQSLGTSRYRTTLTTRFPLPSSEGGSPVWVAVLYDVLRFFLPRERSALYLTETCF